ncbi:MAG: TonB-dependent receptor [Methylophaga sp.]
MPYTTANGAENDNPLEPLLVTASRLGDITNQAASITVISAEDIRRSPARTLPDLLAEQAGVNIVSTNEHKNSATVDIRGFGETAGQNTLILLDGRRLNDVDLSNVNYAAIPYQNIERIEIIRGSGAVLYGDGATGGVINIISKNPKNIENQAIISTTAGSDDYLETNAFGSFANEFIAINANINHTESDGYRDNSDFKQNSGQLDFRIPLNDDELYLQIGSYDNETGLPGTRSVNPTTDINELRTDRKGTDSPNDWAKERTEYLTTGYTAKLSDNDTLVIDAGYRQRQQKSQFDYGFGFGFGDYADTDLTTFSFTPRLIMNRQLANRDIQWIAGIDWYDYDYQSDRADFRRNSNQPVHQLDVQQQSLAFYGQGDLQLTAKTNLTAGVRTQEVRLKARDQFDASASGGGFGSEAAPSNQTNRENSFELGLSHQFTQSFSGFVRGGRSARFGTVDELFQFDSGFQQVFSILAPQTALTTEVGFKYDTSQFSSQLSVFNQNLTDEIRFNPVTFQNENLDKTKRQGLELSAQAKLTETLRLSAAYSYIDAEFREGDLDGHQVPLVPEHTYHLGLTADLPWQSILSIHWNYTDATYFANDMQNDFGRKIPSYQTVDLKLAKRLDALEVALQINNLFDEEYYNFGINGSAAVGNYNAYPLPERTMQVSVSYQFD